MYVCMYLHLMHHKSRNPTNQAGYTLHAAAMLFQLTVAFCKKNGSQVSLQLLDIKTENNLMNP